MRSASVRRWLVRLALLLTPLWVELGLRLYAMSTGNERGMGYHADYGWRPLPHVKKKGRYWGRDQVAFTNERGWRDAPAALEAPPGTRRIVTLGDSFTFGVIADYGERFTERLEQDLPATEVINLGVTGYGTDQELRVLEEEGVRYRPDVVLLMAFLSNDLLDIQYEQNLGWPKPWYELGEEGLVLHPPQPSWVTRVRESSYLGELCARLADSRRSSARLAREHALEDPAPLFLALVQRMADVCADHDARFLVVLAYKREQQALGRTPVETRVVAGLEAAGIPILDTVDLLQSSDDPALDHYGPDGHWSPAGHRALATLIAARLGDLGWLGD